MLLQWGDSSPISLPCVRFRDVAVHTVVAATGGVAAVAVPAFEPITDVVSSLAGNILVEAVTKGFVKAGNYFAIEKPLEMLVNDNNMKQLETGAVNVFLITLKYKHASMEEAILGFFRSSFHEDSTSMFNSMKDYFENDKGWFSPYLFASCRRPDIPRSTQPDIVFCHGPFVQGDYRIGETLLAESAYQVTFCDARPTLPTLLQVKDISVTQGDNRSVDGIPHHLSVPNTLLNRFYSRPSSPEPSAALNGPPPPRQFVLLVIGIKPHRKLWATSKRPGESVIKYLIFDGCPAIVLPAKVSAPLLAWHSQTVDKLWNLKLPGEKPASSEETGQYKDFNGVVHAIYQFLDICVIDWDRVVVSDEVLEDIKDAREAVENAVRLLVAAAVKTRNSEVARKELDEERCGIAMWRIP